MSRASLVRATRTFILMICDWMLGWEVVVVTEGVRAGERITVTTIYFSHDAREVRSQIIMGMSASDKTPYQHRKKLRG